ncbi:hypothetical protein KI387_021906, partial [Taxus chinensis]
VKMPIQKPHFTVMNGIEKPHVVVVPFPQKMLSFFAVDNGTCFAVVFSIKVTKIQWLLNRQIYKLLTVVTMDEVVVPKQVAKEEEHYVVRRIREYHPNVWNKEFLESLSSPYGLHNVHMECCYNILNKEERSDLVMVALARQQVGDQITVPIDLMCLITGGTDSPDVQDVGREY